MVRPYASFVLRCWDLGGGEPRVKVDHVQSGESIRVTTLAAAVDWLGARSSGTPADELDRSLGTQPIHAEVPIEE